MRANANGYRPIVFNGIELPLELMAIDHLERIVVLPESLADWLWRFPICIGREQRCDSAVVNAVVQEVRNALLEQRPRVLEGLRKRLPGYTAEEVYSQWMGGLAVILECARAKEQCVWVAVALPGESELSKEDAKQFLQKLEAARNRLLEGNDRK